MKKFIYLKAIQGCLDDLESRISVDNINNQEEETGMTVLMYCTMYNHTRCVDYLLSINGCNTNLCNSSLNTALMLAIEVGNPIIVQKIVSHSITTPLTLITPNKNPQTPLELAEEKLQYYMQKQDLNKIDAYSNILNILNNAIFMIETTPKFTR